MYCEGVVAVGGVVDSGGVMPFVITLVIRGASFVIPETSTGLVVPVGIFFVIPFVSFFVTSFVIREIPFVIPLRESETSTDLVVIIGIFFVFSFVGPGGSSS